MEHIRFMTLERHIIEGERQHPEATGELSALLSNLALTPITIGCADDVTTAEEFKAREEKG